MCDDLNTPDLPDGYLTKLADQYDPETDLKGEVVRGLMIDMQASIEMVVEKFTLDQQVLEHLARLHKGAYEVRQAVRKQFHERGDSRGSQHPDTTTSIKGDAALLWQEAKQIINAILNARNV